jgi:IS30 family transposase
MRYGIGEFSRVESMLRLDLSPEPVVGRLRLEGTEVMSHETIYKWIWKDKKDKKEGGSLWEHLRGARKRRRKRYARKDSRGRLAGETMIGERPAAVETRARTGDWEINTVHGKGKAGVVTIVERRSGLVRIGQLARITVGHTGARTVRLLRREQNPVRTITADNGSEFHGYETIERSLGTKIYFATPHHSWERGTNENTNGLIRQYLPKGMPLEDITQRTCTSIAEILNDRPRKRLGYKTPNEVYYDLSPVALQC